MTTHLSRLLARVTPSGRVMLSHPSGAPLEGAVSALASALEDDTASGLVTLGVTAPDLALHPSLDFWRALSCRLISALCGLYDPLRPHHIERPTLTAAEASRWSARIPPMIGSEHVTADRLIDLWSAMGAALAGAALAHPEGLRGHLAEGHHHWQVAGRVCLHIAEHPADPEYPFAFIATYARQRPGSDRIHHVPLARALQEFAGERDQLLSLLAPLQRAAKAHPPLASLIDAGDIYHPLAWTPQEAFDLLSAAEDLEAAGLALRIPDWWTGRGRRPKVSVTVGTASPSAVGLAAVMDFDVEVALGGETLTEAEIQQLLSAGRGLTLLKGRWVEVDPEALSGVLDHWRAVGARARAEGLSFAEAMRWVAEGDAESADEDARQAWSQIIAGPWLRDTLAQLRRPEAPGGIEGEAQLKATLRPYQRRGVQWLQTLYGLGLGGCLADDMGLGKTIQVITLLALLKARAPGETATQTDSPRPLDLLIVPASLIDNWRGEMIRFAPQLRPWVAHASHIPATRLKATEEGDLADVDVVITTYGTALRTPWILARRWRCLVLDEAQAIKNPKAKQTRTIKSIDARWRLALTGTPVENRLTDLWSLFDCVSPGLLGSHSDFAKSVKAMDDAPSGYAPLRRLISPYLLRRLKTDTSIIADLPDKTEITTHCLLTKAQAALYRETVATLSHLLETAEKMARRGLVLKTLMQLKQICNHPAQLSGDGDFDPGLSGKMQQLAHVVDAIAARQEKVLVFTQFREMIAPLSRHLTTCFGRPGLEIHGGTPVKQRMARVQAFQTDESVPFMVLSLKAGGTGLNLTAANHVIHFDRWWNPAVEQQATDRAYRIGQHRNVLVHKFVCKGTVEARIDALIQKKEGLANSVLSSSGEIPLTELSDEALLALVRLDLNSAVRS
ncbi:MAG: DEAD/DEAH box helicase [Bradymonadia bacterium]